MVQRLRPSGGLLLAKVSNTASPLASSLHLAPGRGRSFNEAVNPSMTQRFRVRSMVETLVCKASAISSSFLPSSDSNRMLARFTFLAELSPAPINVSNSSRSVEVNSTMYFFCHSLSLLVF